MRSRIVQIVSALMLGLSLLAAVPQADFASASAPKTALRQVAAQPAGPIDPRELEAFLDSLLEAEMAERHVPGASVAVVQDGRLLLAKGYGYADLDGQVPVDPERTLFRIGSVSKLFTWTAVMQLVEQGRLSLDADVNEYLDFSIPATYPEPIAMRHLLSHTAGFESRDLNLWRLQAAEVSSLGDYLEANLPVRVFPPGEVIASSNYGAALAAYIVERISGLPFDEYAEQHIFAPLGMARSTFRQPLPEALSVDMAIGYNHTGGEHVAGGFVFCQAYPAGSMSSTANDMARFMIAHLQNGELGGERILQDDTARQMHTQLFTPDPRLGGGMAYGFFEDTINGQRILSHGGNIITYLSLLFLIPEQNVGVFVTTNSAGGGAVNFALARAFLDRYYPATETPQAQSAAGFADRVSPFLGNYTAARGNFTTSEKTTSLMSRYNAGLGSDGLLEIIGMRFAEVEPGLLQGVDDPSARIVYRTGPEGRPYLMGVLGLRGDPFAVFKSPWYGNNTLHIILFCMGTVLFLGALIAWPAGHFIRRRRRPAAAQPDPRFARLARWAAALFGLLWLLSLLGLASIFADIVPGYGVPSVWFGTPPQMTLVFVLAYLLGVLALTMPLLAMVAWLRRYWTPGGRIFYSLLSVQALLLTWSLVYWNLLL